MDHSLINPNEILMMGMPVYDNPFDNNWNFGIDKNVFIPFKTDGTTVYFDPRVPTQCEITECTHIITTGETEWDPQSV